MYNITTGIFTRLVIIGYFFCFFFFAIEIPSVRRRRIRSSRPINIWKKEEKNSRNNVGKIKSRRLTRRREICVYACGGGGDRGRLIRERSNPPERRKIFSFFFFFHRMCRLAPTLKSANRFPFRRNTRRQVHRVLSRPVSRAARTARIIRSRRNNTLASRGPRNNVIIIVRKLIRPTYQSDRTGTAGKPLTASYGNMRTRMYAGGSGRTGAEIIKDIKSKIYVYAYANGNLLNRPVI